MAGTGVPAYATNLLNRLRGVQGAGRQLTAFCPAHDDQSRSLTIGFNEDDNTLVRCFTGCTAEQVVAAVGMTMADLFSDTDHQDRSPKVSNFRHNSTSLTKGTPSHFVDDAPMPTPITAKPRVDETLVALYTYTDHEGNPVAEKGRFETAEKGADGKPQKSFRWRPFQHKGWPSKSGIKMTELALWGAELVKAAPADVTVYFCEGEKATEACREQGLLAVTFAGGASSKEFGLALEVLKDRNVALWPDNDASGRNYMATVHARLRDLAASVSIVSVPLPPKGDAYDYFAAGGTVAQLESGSLPVDSTSVEYLDEDTIRIIFPSPKGAISFTFAELAKRARALTTYMTIQCEGPGVDRTPYHKRLDLLSHSGGTEIRRELDGIYGKDQNWTKLLNQAIALVTERYMAHDRSVDVFDVEPLSENELFFHDPLLPLNAVTIIFGPRGSGKSYVVEDLAFCTALGEPYLGSRVPQGPVLFIDYEDTDRNFRRRINRLAEGHQLPVLPGVLHYLSLMGLSISDAMRAVRDKVIREGIVLVIVDSLGPATGGDPSATELAISAMQALRSLNVTVVCLAHVAKGGTETTEQPKDPFGSVFYSNLSRRTWYVERVQEEQSDKLDVGLYCKKINDGPMPKPIALEINFQKLNGAVTITNQAIENIRALQEKRPIKQQIWDALSHGQRRTILDLVEELAPATATEADNKRLYKTIEAALADSKRFTVVGQWTPPGKGRPLNLWGQVTTAINQ